MRSYCICLSLSDYFTWHNALKVHPCCCKWQDFIQFFTTELHSIVSVQFSSVTQSRLTLCDPMTTARQVSLSSTSSQNLLQFVSIELVMLSNHLILCPLLLLPSIFPSISVFSKASAPIIRWSKYRSFSNSPSNEYSTLISFRIY